MKRGAGSVPELLKLDKEQVGYHAPPPKGMQPPNGTGVRCGTCAMMYRARGSDFGGCFIVAGPISAQGWCPLWSKDGQFELDFYSGREISLLLRPLTPFLKRIFSAPNKR